LRSDLFCHHTWVNLSNLLTRLRPLTLLDVYAGFTLT
jgi:hypothetical protein